VNKVDLLVERHLLHNQIGTPIGREILIYPGTLRASLRQDRREREHAGEPRGSG
jgi:hypothetical protein